MANTVPGCPAGLQKNQGLPHGRAASGYLRIRQAHLSRPSTSGPLADASPRYACEPVSHPAFPSSPDASHPASRSVQVRVPQGPSPRQDSTSEEDPQGRVMVNSAHILASLHTNILELCVVLRVLCRLRRPFKWKVVLVKDDNPSVILYTNRMCGVRSRSLYLQSS